MFSTLVDTITARRSAGRRMIVGIAGPPGAGKSTLAARLTEVFADGVVVPMDGFHLANVELARLGHADRKGAPFTFDMHGYAALLRRINLGQTRNSLRFEVRDDGSGFTRDDHDGRGLRNMHDRIEACGGHLTVESEPGHGTRVIGSVERP